MKNYQEITLNPSSEIPLPWSYLPAVAGGRKLRPQPNQNDF